MDSGSTAVNAFGMGQLDSKPFMGIVVFTTVGRMGVDSILCSVVVGARWVAVGSSLFSPSQANFWSMSCAIMTDGCLFCRNEVWQTLSDCMPPRCKVQFKSHDTLDDWERGWAEWREL